MRHLVLFLLSVSGCVGYYTPVVVSVPEGATSPPPPLAAALGTAFSERLWHLTDLNNTYPLLTGDAITTSRQGDDQAKIVFEDPLDMTKRTRRVVRTTLLVRKD